MTASAPPGSRFGAARTAAAALGLVAGGYAVAVAVARVLDLVQNDAGAMLNPFGRFAGETAWLNLLVLATFVVGLLVLLAAAAALITRSSRLAVVLAVMAVIGVVVWLAYHVLLVVVLVRDGVGLGTALTDALLPLGRTSPVGGLDWPYDDASRLLIGPAYLLVAVLAMVRRRAPQADTVPDAPPAPAPAGTPPPFDPAPVPVMYVLRIEGAEYGPYSLDRLRGFAAEGRIHRASQVRTTDGGFVPAADVPGLFD